MPPRELHARRLRRMPLPVPDADGDKEDRGRLLIVGGARELPGPLLLAGRAALRAGAGKVQLAAPAALAVPLGVAFPEARVFPLAETAGGDPAPDGAEVVLEWADRAAALLVGPGLGDSPEARALVRAVIGGAGAPVLALDAGALAVIADHPDLLRPHRGRVVVTPHAGEMARLTGVGRERIEADPLGAARRAAAELGAVVALKGAETYVASPDGGAFRYSGGGVGLATSGSGDVLAGIVAGLLARGAEPRVAAAWGVYLHGTAGNLLARARGAIGFLAREIPDEVPGLLERLS